MAVERSGDLNVDTVDGNTRPSGWARWLRFRKHNESSEEESVRSAIRSAEDFDELTRRSGRGLWLRFRKHRLSLLGIGILAIFAIGSIFAPWLSFHDQNRVDLDNIKGPPSVEHFLGTDSAGRDVWARLLFGSRVTLVIAACALIIGVLIGTAIGMVSGYFGGWVDNVLMRFTELIMTFPTLFALIILVAILGGSVWNIMWIIGILGWTGGRTTCARPGTGDTRDGLRCRGRGHRCVRPAYPYLAHPAFDASVYCSRRHAWTCERHPHRGGPKLPGPRRSDTHADVGAT